ncbi:alkaline-phosphatase-like protein [Cokeromyces recurvatus]|uniref:alkaline-phosphatase-like protein n=1 Tax=Cokeromyces recurvatus TaxID=90255 RepID=UPI002220A3CA|nr:alkaline-phosphatase-like protein [Cokeromyces recurvatus]KAI7905956.1 alkaline-phosphatase-like protein [Cokeromyces recurvatus]
MMISDGLGPASVSFARSYYQFINNKPYDYQLPLDTIHVGQSRTRSSSTLVTDSAAGATAFSCNLKTYNGAIGVDPSHLPCGTVLESAKHSRGMLTGLVATSRITHATPASFSAHVENRDDENSIAKQQIGDNPLGRSVDLMFGGGYCYFLPKSKKGSCRSDSRDLLKEAQSKYDWKTVLYNQSREEFDNLPINETVLPIIQLFTSDHMSYEIDRDPRIEPSLSEMSKKALDILYDAVENKETGFFLMIEGSRIDMAAHSNDAAAHVHEILEYQNTVELVKKYVDEHPDTVMISTSDHETGGLSLARQTSKKYPEYLWYPDVLTKVKSSTYNLAKMIKSQKTLTEDYIMSTIFKDHLGIIDGTNAEIIELMKTSTSTKYITQFLADMISIRAQLGWATHGHSGVDVNLYAYGQGSNHLFGSHENIQIGEFITKILDLNLTEISIKLNHENPSFHLTNLTDTDKLKYNEDLEHYHFVPSHLKHIPFFSK